MSENTDETQVNLQAIRTSVDKQTKSLLETIADTSDRLHEKLGLMTQVETQMNKSLIDTM
jgi:signal recognition particle GTPase